MPAKFILHRAVSIGEFLVDRNAYPREALYEALLRLIDEDLGKADTSLLR